MMMFDDEQDLGACIKVIGVGGAGGNAINTMIEAGVEDVQFIVANTDRQALSANMAEDRIQIGANQTKGLGAGSNPRVGEAAARESASQIQDYLRNANMVFVTAGMGGGTGTGAAPVVASLAREVGALTIGVVTKPFKFEGKHRRRQAEEGLEKLQQCVDTLITIPNERLLSAAGEEVSLVDAFKMADNVLLHAVRSISELITKHGYINTDFADVRTVMSNKGVALMGTGIGTGQDRAIMAAEAAINSPLLDNVSLSGATNILLNITSPGTVKLSEVSEAVALIEEAASDDVHLIWGHVFDEEIEGIKITIIATGFQQEQAQTGDDFKTNRAYEQTWERDRYGANSGNAAAGYVQPNFNSGGNAAARQAAPSPNSYAPSSTNNVNYNNSQFGNNNNYGNNSQFGNNGYGNNSQFGQATGSYMPSAANSNLPKASYAPNAPANSGYAPEGGDFNPNVLKQMQELQRIQELKQQADPNYLNQGPRSSSYAPVSRPNPVDPFAQSQTPIAMQEAPERRGNNTVNSVAKSVLSDLNKHPTIEEDNMDQPAFLRRAQSRKHFMD